MNLTCCARTEREKARTETAGAGHAGVAGGGEREFKLLSRCALADRLVVVMRPL